MRETVSTPAAQASRLTAWLMIAPAHVMLFIAIVIPGLLILAMSFTAATFGRPSSFVGLANYTRILSDPQFWRSLANTIMIVLAVVHLELALGLGMALLFASGLPLRRILLAIVLAPYAVSEVSAAIVWRYLFDPDVGPVSTGMRALGLPVLEWSIDPTHGLIIIALLSVWLHLPFTFLVLYAARLGIPKELYEAAKVDGAARWATFRAITWPMLKPAMLIAMLFRYIIVFRLFSEVWLMTQGGPARTSEVLAVYLYLEAFRFNSFGVAAATGWIMLVVSLVLGAGYVWLIRREMTADAR